MSLLTINDGLIHYWKMDGESGNLVDEVENEYQITDTAAVNSDLVRATVGTGGPGAIAVNSRPGLGKAQHIVFGDTDNATYFGADKHFEYQFADGFCATALVKVPTVITGDIPPAPGAWIMGINSSVAGAREGWGLTYQISGGNVTFQVWMSDGGPSYNELEAGPIVIEADRFYHILIGLEITDAYPYAGELVLRVDNVEYRVARTSYYPLIPAWILTGLYGFQVGMTPNDLGAGSSDVTIDEIGMWNRMLTAEEWYWDIYRFGSGSTYPFEHVLHTPYASTLYPAVSGQCRSNACRIGYAPPYSSLPSAHDDTDDVVPLRRETYREVTPDAVIYTEVLPWEDSQS
jgi:hypothetical protein